MVRLGRVFGYGLCIVILNVFVVNFIGNLSWVCLNIYNEKIFR